MTPNHLLGLLRAVIIIGGLVVLTFLALPARAHTQEEMNQWLMQWSDRMEHAFVTDGDFGHLIAELYDMENRHPWWNGEFIDIEEIARSDSGESEPPLHVEPAKQVTAPAPEPEPEPVTYGKGVEQWRDLVTAYFGGKTDVALCIMEIESGGDPTAHNTRTGASGLFQFMPSTWSSMVPDSITGGNMDSVWTPETNIAGAAWLQGAEGWGQWSPWKRGECH